MAGLERGVRPIGLWSISMILSMCSTPSTASCSPGSSRAPLSCLASGPIEDVGHERALARAGDAGHGDEAAERERRVDAAEVVLAGPADDERLAVALPPLGPGSGTARSPRRKAPVIERGSARTASSGPLAMISPPCSPAPGPMSRTQSAVRIVSSSCSTTRTVLPRSRSRVSVAMSLALSRWWSPIDRLVEDVQDAHQGRPDLGREADPLGLAARQGDARPVDGQVVQADVDEEAEPGGRSP